MRNGSFALLLLLFIFVSGSAAQTVKISPKVQVYTRKAPIVGFKKTFKIRRPAAAAATAELSRKITALIDPVRVLEIDLKEELTETQWLSEADYEEIFNQDGILSMMLWMEGSAAYTDGVTKYVVIDTVKGTQVTPKDVFNDIPALIAAVKKKQDAEVEKAISDIKKDPEWGDSDPKQLFEYTDLTEKDLANFVVDKAGVAFFYDYGFPNVVKALEPDGELRFSWAEITPFLKRDGLLGRFAR
ncbi:MAG TPA: hypothetical protein PKD26_05940 [Pyrinomonadaceae bacterium]|nr:hypothetical protein [Pyrinomonadaceae bacterium]